MPLGWPLTRSRTEVYRADTITGYPTEMRYLEVRDNRFTTITDVISRRLFSPRSGIVCYQPVPLHLFIRLPTSGSDRRNANLRMFRRILCLSLPIRGQRTHLLQGPYCLYLPDSHHVLEVTHAFPLFPSNHFHEILRFSGRKIVVAFYRMSRRVQLCGFRQFSGHLDVRQGISVFTRNCDGHVLFSATWDQRFGSAWWTEKIGWGRQKRPEWIGCKRIGEQEIKFVVNCMHKRRSLSNLILAATAPCN